MIFEDCSNLIESLDVITAVEYLKMIYWFNWLFGWCSMFDFTEYQLNTYFVKVINKKKVVISLKYLMANLENMLCKIYSWSDDIKNNFKKLLCKNMSDVDITTLDALFINIVKASCIKGATDNAINAGKIAVEMYSFTSYKCYKIEIINSVNINILNLQLKLQKKNNNYYEVLKQYKRK